MKKITFIALTLLLCAFSACEKEDSNSELPEATQTGAGIFACYVNGKTFIDRSYGLNCYYQLVEGGYYFGVSGEDRDYRFSNIPWGIHLFSDDHIIVEGQTYTFSNREEGNVSASVFITISLSEYYSIQTNNQYSGEMTITKLDFENGIVSGTFWFDVQHPTTGETIEIRDGRFDSLFSQ